MPHDPTSRALGRPRRPRPRKPKHIYLQLTARIREVLDQFLQLLLDKLRLLEMLPERERQYFRRHIMLGRIAVSHIDMLLQSNPRRIVLDPDDIVSNGIFFFLNELCESWLQHLARAEAEAQAAAAASYAAAYNRQVYEQRYYSDRYVPQSHPEYWWRGGGG